MNCKICAKLMDEYAGGALPGDMRTMVEGHLSDCATCRQAFADYASVSSALTGSLLQTTGSLRMRPEEEEGVLRALGAEPAELPFEDMMKLFETLSFREKWSKVRYGLKQPKDTGAYKWAVLQVKRLISPAAAVLVPSLAMLLMVVLAGMAPQRQTVVNVRILEDQHIPELEEPIDIPEPEIQPPDPEHIVEPMDNFIPSTSKTAVGPDVDFSPQPAQFDSVAIIRSPVTMRGVFGSRSPGARGSMLGRHGGGGHTEGAVLRALRWLKKHQEEDGSWNQTSGGGAGGGRFRGADAGMTGLALLCYLAHGETPASPEFGQTVQRAIQWLVANQHGDGYWGRTRAQGGSYEHPIATYAIAEAYGMLRIPSLLEPAVKGLRFIVGAQNPQGGWAYRMNPGDTSDISVMGWCVQAMKAGQMAAIEVPGMEEALERATRGIKELYHKGNYSFNYRPNSSHGGRLTGVGVLALQLAGEARSEEAQGGIQWLVQNDRFEWNQGSEFWRNIYRWYYNTQARFHEGGEVWREWNRQFSVPLVNAQTVIPNGIADLNGKMVDIGYWCANDLRSGRVTDTALSALQLMVYYRYLPTFQTPEQIAAADGGGPAAEDRPRVVEARDLDIEIQL